MNPIKRHILVGLVTFALLGVGALLMSHRCAASEATGESSLWIVTVVRMAIWVCIIGCSILLYTYRVGYRVWGIDRDRWVNGRATTLADARAVKPGLPKAPKVGLGAMDWAVLLIILVIGSGSAVLLSRPKPPAPFLLVEKNAVESMNALIKDKPALVHAHNSRGVTLLMAASRNGQVDMVECLLSHGVAVNTADRSGRTALAYAVGQPELLDLLLHNGASANLADASGTTPLHLAIRQKCRLSCIALLNHGARVDAPAAGGLTPLIMAVDSGFDGIHLLLSHGAKPDLIDQAGASALHCAARIDNLEAAQALILAGADMTLPSLQGWTPLHVAALHESWTVAAVLLKEGAAVDGVNQRSQTPLSCAVYKGNQAFVEFLVEHGADVNFVGQRGNTYLHDALLKEDLDMASLLIAQGATLELANSAGFTPKQMMANLKWHPKQELTAKTNLPRVAVPLIPDHTVAFVQ